MKRFILLLLVIVSGTSFAQTTPADSTSEHGKDLMRDLFFPHWETADKGIYVGWAAGAMMDLCGGFPHKEVTWSDWSDVSYGIEMLTNIELKYNRLWFCLGIGYFFRDLIDYHKGKPAEEHLSQYVNLLPSLKYSIISRRNFQLILGVELWRTRFFRYMGYFLEEPPLVVIQKPWRSPWASSLLMPVELYYSLNPTCSLFFGIDAGELFRVQNEEYKWFYINPHVFRVGLRCKIK